jgi:hypothetical protein
MREEGRGKRDEGRGMREEAEPAAVGGWRRKEIGLRIKDKGEREDG